MIPTILETTIRTAVSMLNKTGTRYIPLFGTIETYFQLFKVDFSIKTGYCLLMPGHNRQRVLKGRLLPSFYTKE